MKVSIPVVAAMAVFLASRTSLAEPNLSARPRSSGVGLLVGGGIATGIGGVNLLSALLCTTSLYSSISTDLCYGIAFGVGGVGLAVGIPMLVVGANKRAAYREWLKDHPAVEELSVIPVRGGAAIVWSADF
jgi:hypothetical protein